MRPGALPCRPLTTVLVLIIVCVVIVQFMFIKSFRAPSENVAPILPTRSPTPSLTGGALDSATGESKTQPVYGNSGQPAPPTPAVEETSPIEKGPVEVIYTFSVDSTYYQQWQARVLAYTFRKTNQGGTLIRLYGTSDKTIETAPNEDEVPSIIVGEYAEIASPSPRYVPYNRPYQMLEWLVRTNGSDDDIVLFVDPDMYFTGIGGSWADTLRDIVKPGTIYGNYYDYLEAPKWRNTLENPRLCSLGFEECRKYWAPIGAPVAFTRGDLQKIIPLWIAKITILTREDSSSTAECKGECWIREMIALPMAIAELRLAVTWERFALEPPYIVHHTPKMAMSHYNHWITKANSTHQWDWDKRNTPPFNYAWPQANRDSPVMFPPIERQNEPGTWDLFVILNEAMKALPGLSVPQAKATPLSELPPSTSSRPK